MGEEDQVVVLQTLTHVLNPVEQGEGLIRHRVALQDQLLCEVRPLKPPELCFLLVYSRQSVFRQIILGLLHGEELGNDPHRAIVHQQCS
jgi:hypothetical protein